MPPGTPFHGLIPPFPIRVDEFGATPGLTSVPALHLLSHTHSDHTVGLSAKSFASTVICSPDAKEMLLRHEVYNERVLKDINLRDEVRLSKTFGHLKIPPLLKGGKFDYSTSRDLLRTIPLHTPTRIELRNNQIITLTLFDANHCPGAVMFLVEGAHGAVLHTGDFRAEPWFLDDIRRNPFLQPYLAPPKPQEGTVLGQADAKCPETTLFKTLDAIYLDTASLLFVDDVPTKSDATQGLVSLMTLFPPETTFFINAWTWGYEDIFRAVARSFQSQIHVDRYKHTIYSHLIDPFLRSVTTLDPSKTRFHACEQFGRCPHASAGHVVYINPVMMARVKWEQYRVLMESKLRAAQPVSILLVPLSRHSPLQELRAFVSLFRPARVVPNTLDPSFRGLDALCIPHLFADCLSSPPSPPSSFVAALVVDDMEMNGDHDDDALQNLVGDGADIIARSWADLGRRDDKLAVIEPFLRGTAHDVFRRTLGLPSLPPEKSSGDERAISILQRMRDAQRIQACRGSGGASDQETESEDEDAHMRTARMLFGIAGMSQVAGSPGVPQEQMQAFGSFKSRCLLLEERSGGAASVREVHPALRMPTPLASGYGSQQKTGEGTSRHGAGLNLAWLQTQPLHTNKDACLEETDPKLSSVAHLSSPPSLASPARHRSHAAGRDDLPLTDLQNIPFTGTQQTYFQAQSRSQYPSASRSQSPSWPASLSLIHSPSSNTAVKRRKIERRLSLFPEDDVPKPVLISRRRVASTQVAEAARTGKSTDIAQEQDLAVRTEISQARRRPLRARSRIIEEKLRRALPTPSPQGNMGLT